MGKDIKNLVRNEEAELWREALKMVLAKKKAFYFRKPVDFVALNIPHYPTIVAKPMDLGTIESKLGRNMYKTRDEFAADVRLVFSNAVLFNKVETHQVHVAAVQLRAFFEDRFKELESGTFRRRDECVGAKKANGQSSGGTRSATRSAAKPAEPEKRATRGKPAAKKGGKPAAKGGTGERAKAAPNPRAPPTTPRDGPVPAAEVLKMQEQLLKLQSEMAALKRQVGADAPSSESSSAAASDDDDDEAMPPPPALTPTRAARSRSPSSASLPTECVSLNGSSPPSPTPSGLFGDDADPDASLDGSGAGDDGLSPEDCSAYASAIVEMTDDDEIAALGGGASPQARGKRRLDGATPPGPKKHRFTMSPADLSPVPGMEVAKLFRAGSDFGSVLSDSGLDLEAGTSPLWTFDENPPAPIAPIPEETAAE
ncbi:transcription factor [Aureococcus anophagefferens]|nr:transcription factor [Aureococcus anophagefferens]